MGRLAFLIAALAAIASAAIASAASAQGRPPRFWNLTGETIREFYLAPAGTSAWGPNQCKNDRDGTVDPDERLNITGTPPGTYDAKFTDVKGRTCEAHGIEVKAGEIFSLEERDLTACTN